MKKTFFLLLNLFFGLYLSGQNCVPVAIVFSNQAQVDAFPSQYPGCKRILGNVGITGSVVNLDSLIRIESIVGSLSILDASISSINGLSNIDSIGGSLIVERNYINSFLPLQNVLHIGQNIVFQNNSNITAFPTFQFIEKIGGSLTMRYSGSSSAVLFPNLDSLSTLYITSFSMQQGSFPTLQKVRENLVITHNDILPSFNNLQFVGRDFQLSKLGSSISQISGFNSLHTVINALRITENEYITLINGLNGLLNTKELHITHNQFLSSISGLNHNFNLRSLSIFNNPFLSNCSIIPICNSLANIPSLSYLQIENNGTNCSTIAQIQSACPAPPDSDGDGVNNYIDNCPTIPNSNQADANLDGQGNVCDNNSDSDSDTVMDNVDNCVSIPNQNQANANNDAEGDVCDGNSDSDNDGRNDNIDNCTSIFNPDQKDCNANWKGDVCEAFVDTDCDGRSNAFDNCPTLFNPNQIDSNSNSVGDACESFGKMGFNTLNPKTEMHLSNTNIFMDNPDKGLIMKDVQGNCYKTSVVIVNNVPQFKLFSIPCPQ
jgi:hypothetical protein